MSGELAYGSPLRITEVKAAGDAWEVAGYASTFGNTDLGGDVVHKGAFTDTLSSGRPVRFLFSHDPSQVLGTVVELKEDEQGLAGRFRISRTRLGEDVHTLLKDGALDSFSIGYLPRDFEIDRKAGVRNLTGVELLEVSVVAMPMNPQALVSAVKAADLVAGEPEVSVPLDDVIEVELLRGNNALRAVKALWERRREGGREPSDRLVALVDAYRRKRLTEADDLLALLTGPDDAPTEVPSAASAPPPDAADPAAKAAAGAVVTVGRVDGYLRLARLRESRQKLGLPPLVLTPVDGADGVASQKEASA